MCIIETRAARLTGKHCPMRKTNTVNTKYQGELLSIALIQPKAGPRSLGTPFLVTIIMTI